jgi:hypothetical protein
MRWKESASVALLVAFPFTGLKDQSSSLWKGFVEFPSGCFLSANSAGVGSNEGFCAIVDPQNRLEVSGGSECKIG